MHNFVTACHARHDGQVHTPIQLRFAALAGSMEVYQRSSCIFVINIPGITKYIKCQYGSKVLKEKIEKDQAARNND